MVLKVGAVGGIVVTSSHNPVEWNGTHTHTHTHTITHTHTHTHTHTITHHHTHTITHHHTHITHTITPSPSHTITHITHTPSHTHTPITHTHTHTPSHTHITHTHHTTITHHHTHTHTYIIPSFTSHTCLYCSGLKFIDGDGLFLTPEKAKAFYGQVPGHGDLPAGASPWAYPGYQVPVNTASSSITHESSRSIPLQCFACFFFGGGAQVGRVEDFGQEAAADRHVDAILALPGINPAAVQARKYKVCGVASSARVSFRERNIRSESFYSS